MSANIKPNFSNEEAQSLLNLIDVAVKAVGLNAAFPAHVLAMRIQEAMEAAATMQKDDGANGGEPRAEAAE